MPEERTFTFTEEELDQLLESATQIGLNDYSSKLAADREKAALKAKILLLNPSET